MLGGARLVKSACAQGSREDSPWGVGSKGRHPVAMYHIPKVQGLLKEEEQDETWRKKVAFPPSQEKQRHILVKE